MSALDPPAEDMSNSQISELNPSYTQARFPHLNFDLHKLSEKMEKEYQEIRKQLQRSYNPSMRNECKRLKTFFSYDSGSSWAPTEMAAAGFYYTGVKSGIQCFCCGLVLFAAGARLSPDSEHKKFRPQCEFVQEKEVGNILRYDIRVQNVEKSPTEPTDRYKEEEARLQSFEAWPFYARGTQPAALSSAGFFFTGEKDKVQCFACGGCLGNWEEGDDPWKEHAKWFPECEFLRHKKSSDEIKQYLHSYCGFVGVVGKHFTTPSIKRILSTETGEGDVQCFACAGCLENWEEGDDPWKEHKKWLPDCKCLELLNEMTVDPPKNQSALHSEQQTAKPTSEGRKCQYSAFTDMTLEDPEWTQEAKALTEHLRQAYSNTRFSRLPSFGDSTHFAIDLKLLYADLSVVSKDIYNQPLQQLLLPDILANLNSITVLEGEAGGGKTALLRKVAVLWASGCCPVLSRFKLVFYLSLSATKGDQSLTDIICNQLVGFPGSLTEMSLRNILQHLKHQVLFLLDDYGEMNSVPSVIEGLVQKNHFNKHCLVIAVRTNRIREIRKHANTILTIVQFPLYSTLYVLRKLFSHNIALVEKFIYKLKWEDTMKTLLKTPLLTVALCTYWIQYPGGNIFSDKAIFKAYLLYNSLKYLEEGDHVSAMVSSCGELALKGLFKPCFDFREEDLSEIGLDGDEALRLGLLSKFTAQRLQPVYQFFHPSFQEFLAGLRMSELLASDVEENLERGLYYLQQINTLRKVSGTYHFLLQYACSYPSKAVPKIITHLFNLIHSKEAFESQAESDELLRHHPELQMVVQAIDDLESEFCLSFFTRLLLNIAISAAYESDTVAMCAPAIFEFLRGKTFSFGTLVSQYSFLLWFFLDFPESLSFPSTFYLNVHGKKYKPKSDFSDIGIHPSELEVPTIDTDYASAFINLNDMSQRMKELENNVNSFFSLVSRFLPDSLMAPFILAKGRAKISALKFVANAISSLEEADLRNLMVLFSISDNIELCLNDSPGLVESIRPALEQHKECFKKCSLCNVNLSVAEQELLLSMSSVESLEIKEDAKVPELLFTNLDKFTCLKGLSVYVQNGQNVFNIMPSGFGNIHSMERLLIDNVNFSDSSSRLVGFIQGFQNLRVFHLNTSSFLDCDSLLATVSSCKKLMEIRFTGSFMRDRDMLSFADILPNFLFLKVLDLNEQYITDEETSQAFASALGCLVNLEELYLPAVYGIKHAAKLIVQQCSHLQLLRCFSFHHSLNDESLLEIAKVACNGGFQKLENLSLSSNHNVTEAGWTNFFQVLFHMPSLKELNISRTYTQQIKLQATTVKSFVQCVSRLPRLVYIQFYGWLLDAEDLKMFETMKEQHPQSKRLKLSWQWMLPFSPILQE
ncbi:baculoviral IAP repeat-containing protein 1-like [Alligator mississippiensis]|uniref:baculoviral IAP repeat-containing protein 1-like n=1 Tax=Alligator mississippiensis TaxID=8496 RepID=UPI002877D2F8|nr:baculoviral IAP repeat-containing protein 1-like [Alligator mississippiensis]